MTAPKIKWIKTDAWRGYGQPVNAICGVNDTGTWDDSPCNSNTAERELKMAIKILTDNNIPHKFVTCKTSNVFCVHHYLCVDGRRRRKAISLIKHLPDETSLLYLV